jgi:hypothetical protein
MFLYTKASTKHSKNGDARETSPSERKYLTPATIFHTPPTPQSFIIVKKKGLVRMSPTVID